MRCHMAASHRLSGTYCAVWLAQRLLQDFYEGMELEGTVEAVYYFHGIKVDIGGQFDGCVSLPDIVPAGVLPWIILLDAGPQHALCSSPVHSCICVQQSKTAALAPMMQACTHTRRLIPAYATEDDWAQLQGEFQLDTPVRVRIHKVSSAALCRIAHPAGSRKLAWLCDHAHGPRQCA